MGNSQLTMPAPFTRPSSCLSVLSMLLRFRAVALRNQVHNLKHESRLKMLVVGTLGLGFWLGLFVLFAHGFKFLNLNAGPFYQFLVHHILSLFFLAVALMLVFSNAVI